MKITNIYIAPSGKTVENRPILKSRGLYILREGCIGKMGGEYLFAGIGGRGGGGLTPPGHGRGERREVAVGQRTGGGCKRQPGVVFHGHGTNRWEPAGGGEAQDGVEPK